VLNLNAGNNTLAFYGLGATDTLIDNVDLEAYQGGPTLSIVVSGTNAILSWSTNFPGFTLLCTTNLSPAAWMTNSAAPAVINGNYTITNAISGVQQFYRLSL